MFQESFFVSFFGLYVQIPWIFIWYVWFSVKCPLTLSTLKIVLNWVWWQIAVCRTNLACVPKVRERLLNQVGTGMNSLIWAIDEELKLSLHLPVLWVPSTISCLYSWLRTACPAWRLLRTSSFPLIPLKNRAGVLWKVFTVQHWDLVQHNPSLPTGALWDRTWIAVPKGFPRGQEQL